MYHGIVIDQEFVGKQIPKCFEVFAKKQAGSWGIYGIKLEDSELENAIGKIQEEMESGNPWYAHLYNDENLIVIFKDKVFWVKPDSKTWGPIIDYGRELKIPEDQLDFWPNKFEDESRYFSS